MRDHRENYLSHRLVKTHERECRATMAHSSLVVERSLPVEDERKGRRRVADVGHDDEEPAPIRGYPPVCCNAGSVEQRRRGTDRQHRVNADWNRGDRALWRDEEELLAVGSPAGRRAAG